MLNQKSKPLLKNNMGKLKDKYFAELDIYLDDEDMYKHNIQDYVWSLTAQ